MPARTCGCVSYWRRRTKEVAGEIADDGRELRVAEHERGCASDSVGGGQAEDERERRCIVEDKDIREERRAQDNQPEHHTQRDASSVP